MEQKELDIKNFQPYSSVNDTDKVLMTKNGADASITIALLRSQLSRDVKPTIVDGVWHIGTINTNIQAVGKSPEFQTSANGIEWRYEGDTAWIPLVEYDVLKLNFDDLTAEQKQDLKLTLADLTPAEITELQQPARDMITVLSNTNDEAETAEGERMTTEEERITSETTRKNAETARITSEQQRDTAENSRVSAETNRTTAEQNRASAETNRTTAENARITAEEQRLTKEQERNTAELNRTNAENERMAAETIRVTIDQKREQDFITAKTASETATASAEDTAAHPTYIGVDNYVYIWNKTTKAYDKTTTYVKGDPFSIKKTYSSIAQMESDFEGTDTILGDFVLIETTNVENPDNSKLYVKTATEWGFLTDMSGAIGFTGKTPQFTIGTVTTIEPDIPASVTISEDGTDISGNPKYKLNLAIPKGEGLDYTTLTPEEKENIKGMNAYAIAIENGYVGTESEWLLSLKGDKIELRKTSTHIQWRYKEQLSWSDLVLLSELKGIDGINGIDGKSVELQVTSTHIQWRLVGSSTWINIITLGSLKGADGRNGIDGTNGRNGIDGTDGANGAKWYVGTLVTGTSTSSATVSGSVMGDFYLNTSYGYVYEKTSSTTWTYRCSIHGATGSNGYNGSNGISADYQWNGTSLRMYGASGWSSYVDLKGNTGDKGETGVFDPSTVLSSLTTSDKTVPGAINELNNGKAKTDLSNATLIKSLTSNGYYKAPDGLMMQWGEKTSSSSTGSIYFPISFTELFSVTTAVSDVTLNYGYGAYVNSNTTSRFDYRVAFTGSGGAGNGAAEGFYWIAIGRWK